MQAQQAQQSSPAAQKAAEMQEIMTEATIENTPWSCVVTMARQLGIPEATCVAMADSAAAAALAVYRAAQQPSSPEGSLEA